MCGSFGKGEEGRLVACAQCGQCYHSYCASIKVIYYIYQTLNLISLLCFCLNINLLKLIVLCTSGSIYIFVSGYDCCTEERLALS